MPIDPELQRELEKRGLTGAVASPTQASGLWDEIQKRGLNVEAAEPQTSAGAGLWEGLKRGAQDVLEQGATVGARMMQAGPEEGAGAFDMSAQRQAAAAAVTPALQRSGQAFAQNPAVRQHPIASTLGRVGGNIAVSAPLMGVPGESGAGMALGGRALLGAGMGAATGGAPGAVAGGLTGGLGGAIGPRIAPAFQRIAQEFPNLTQMVTGAVGRTAESFQRATANEVLAPIGQAVQRTVKVGHDLVNYVGDKLDEAYNKVLPKVTFRAAEPNPATGASFATGLKRLGEEVPEAHANDFAKLAKRQFESRLDEAGNMGGDEYKKVDREIGRLVRRYSGYGATADNQEYAEVLRNLQANMRDTLRLTNPEQSPVLQKIDQAWARYVRMQEAAGRRIDSNGEFMPNDLLIASRKGAGNRAFSQGDLLMQKFGEAGNDLLVGRAPNAQKLFTDLLGIAGGGTAGAMMGGPIGGAAGGVIGRDIGREVGPMIGGAISRVRQTPGARALGAAVSRSAPIAGAGAEDPTKRREPYVSSVGP